MKLRALQSDLAKYEQVKAKNAQMIKNATESERQLEQLRREIVDMKKLKVKLINQLREETHKSKMEEQRRQREIAALKRDHLRKDNQIRSLEAEKRCREIVLKRKQEQIQVRRVFLVRMPLFPAVNKPPPLFCSDMTISKARACFSCRPSYRLETTKSKLKFGVRCPRVSAQNLKQETQETRVCCKSS